MLGKLVIFGMKHSSNVDLPNNAIKLTIWGIHKIFFDTCFTYA